VAPWLNLTLARSTLVLPDDTWPACFPDLNGQVYLRGHITLSPVPAVGGSLLAIFPLDPEGNCSCTPENNGIIATSTAISYPRDTPNIADVCIVRLLIDKDVFADVNLDRLIDEVDVHLVETSEYFTLDPFAPSKCPEDTGCGRVDVNRDGKVTQLDSTSITQSAFLGTNVTCGGIYATAFSCGSTRTAPLTPAIGISLDTISYFSDDGLMVEGKLLEHQFLSRSMRGDPALIDNILVEFDNLQSEMSGLKEELHETKERLEKRIDESEERDQIHDQRHNKSENSIEKLSLLYKITRSDGHSLLVDVFISIAVVLVCGALALAFQKSRR
jgi:hypothetical protein